MKKSIINSIIFNPIAKTIDTGIQDFDIRNLYAVINQTTQTIIYATSKTGFGFTNINNSIITLEFDTSLMNNNDVLQIIYDDSEDLQIAQALYEVAERLSFLTAVRGTSADIRTTIINSSITSLISGGTLGGITNIGPHAANSQIPSLMNIAAENNIKNIIVS